MDRHFKSLRFRIVLASDTLLNSAGPIESTWFPADTASMAKKTEPAKPASWDVYKIAKKAMWLGIIDAPDKQAAVEKAAQEFKTEVWRLYAVATAMTREGEITRSDLKRKWPHHLALLAKKAAP